MKVTFRNSCWVSPALRQVSFALGMCLPVAQASNSLGEALLIFMTKWKSCMLTLPAPPPPPAENVPRLVSPKLQDSSSISFLWPSCFDSPSMPSIFRK